MDFIRNINKPYPLILNRWKIIISISMFIGLFITIFQPFGLQYIQIDNKLLILFGYSMVTFFLLLINLIILPRLLPTLFNEDLWTIKKQMIWLLWIVISISVGNYFYSILLSIFTWLGIKGFLLFITYTLSIAIIPITAVTLISQNVYLKKNVASSEKINHRLINHSIDKDIENEDFIIEHGNRSFKIASTDLLYIESEGNYINIKYLEKSIVKTKNFRCTIKSIETELKSEYIIRSHRAFIVNLAHLDKVEGNSQGYSLKLKNIDEKIPVSRGYSKIFKTRIDKTWYSIS